MVAGGRGAGGALLEPFTASLSLGRMGQCLARVSSGGPWSTTGYTIPNAFVSCLSLEDRLNAVLIPMFQENIFCNYYRKCCDGTGKGVGPRKCDLVGRGVSWVQLD